MKMVMATKAMEMKRRLKAKVRMVTSELLFASTFAASWANVGVLGNRIDA